MEVIAQWLDDLDDLVAAIGLLTERLRNFFITASIFGISLMLQTVAIIVALRHPPIASAIATLLVVLLMYRSATAPRIRIPLNA